MKGFIIGLVAGLAIVAFHAWAFDSSQRDKSHCAPGVQGRCIEIELEKQRKERERALNRYENQINPCGEGK